MFLMLVIALLLIGTALALGARAASLPRLLTGKSLGQIGAYGFGSEAAMDADARSPLLPKLAGRLGERFAGRLGAKHAEEVRRTLLSAGLYGIDETTFLGYRLLAALLGTALVLWLALAGKASPALIAVTIVYGPLLGWILPMFLVRARARRRLERIELELPELIDLLVVTLEAGMAFSGALQRSGERLSGPLGDELRLALREQSLGLSTERALQGMVDRCDAPALRSFVRAVVQGEALGVSIAQVMRELAVDLRKRRRQIIEEKAQKAPIKMLFPLAFLILPPMFIVLLYPGLTNIITTLGGG
jgi:tight adherence protein C